MKYKSSKGFFKSTILFNEEDSIAPHQLLAQTLQMGISPYPFFFK